MHEGINVTRTQITHWLGGYRWVSYHRKQLPILSNPNLLHYRRKGRGIWQAAIRGSSSATSGSLSELRVCQVGTDTVRPECRWISEQEWACRIVLAGDGLSSRGLSSQANNRVLFGKLRCPSFRLDTSRDSSFLISWFSEVNMPGMQGVPSASAASPNT